MEQAGKGVTLVVNRCDAAKDNGFIDLSGCDLVSVPNAIYLKMKSFGPEDVWAVSLDNNELKKFPKKIMEKFPNLQMLSLATNNLAEIGKGDIPPYMDSLKKLNLSWNALTECPVDALQCASLDSLDVSHNKITDIDLDAIAVQPGKPRELIIYGNPLSNEFKKKLLSWKSKPAEIVLRVVEKKKNSNAAAAAKASETQPAESK